MISPVYELPATLSQLSTFRSGQWKLIWGYAEGLTSEVTRKDRMTARENYAQTFFRAAQEGLLQLYDLEADPGETNNLAHKYRHIAHTDTVKLK